MQHQDIHRPGIVRLRTQGDKMFAKDGSKPMARLESALGSRDIEGVKRMYWGRHVEGRE